MGAKTQGLATGNAARRECLDWPAPVRPWRWFSCVLLAELCCSGRGRLSPGACMCKANGRRCTAARWWEGLFWSLLEVCEGHQQGLHYSTYSAHGSGTSLLRSSLPAAEARRLSVTYLIPYCSPDDGLHPLRQGLQWRRRPSRERTEPASGSSLRPPKHWPLSVQPLAYEAGSTAGFLSSLCALSLSRQHENCPLPRPPETATI